jgi:hypothetical protein
MTTTPTVIPLRFAFFLASNLAALQHTKGGTTMNNEEKPLRWGKWKEERNPNRFLERIDDDMP